MSADLTTEQAERAAALERIEAAAAEWRDSLNAAIDVGCAPEAIQARVMSLVSDVFGVDPAAIQGMMGMLG